MLKLQRGPPPVLESLLTAYGYPILVIGTFFEGETIMVLGGVSAHLGYLSLKWVIVWGFVGTVFGDQLYFYLGRRHGNKLLRKHPAWQARTKRVFHLLHRHQDLLILGFRFLYGIRTVTPFAIGMSEVSRARFTCLNVVGALLWAVSIALAGFYFGQAVEAMLGDIKRYETEIMAGIAGIALLFWVVHFHRRPKGKTDT